MRGHWPFGLSGGYSAVSYRLVADYVQELINLYGGI